MTDYNLLKNQIISISEGVSWDITILSNAAAVIWESLENINWAGFYLMRDGELMLGPFQGRPACTVIPPGKGVCGAAAKLGKTQLVMNVHEFPGHIACDSASNSEIVVPLYIKGVLFGVLDIDSPLLNRFTEEDKYGLEQTAAALEEVLSRRQQGL